MLKVEGLSAGYGRLQIITEVSLRAEEGQVTVIVGPNGSGKSTLLKAIAGVARVFAGEVKIGDETISGLPPHQIARMGLAFLPQTESVFTRLTVEENIRMAAYTVARSDYEVRLGDGVKMFPQISRYMGTKVQNLSGGERQMVAMTMAMMRKPRVLMFDEPTANLAPIVATQVLETIASLARSGLTVVLVEQNARKALEMGDNACLLVGGKKAFDGKAKDLLEHKELSSMYLGLRADAPS
jgi:branched-chain amino acid transport system ATP-binding protein